MTRIAATTIAVATLLLLTAAPEAWAQVQRLEEVDLPRDVAEEILDLFNDSSLVRFNGRSAIPAGRTLIADVGVLGGPFTIGGRIEGAVIVLNGDVRFVEGGVVDGDVMVVGGEVTGVAQGSITGNLVVYGEALPYRESQGRITYRDVRRERDDDGFLPGRSRFMVRTAGTYNRVEGLPVLFGPVLETGGAHPMRFEGMGLWRTESGLTLDEDELGYLFRVQQAFGNSPRWTLSGGASSTIDPISDWGLSGIESSLSTFLFHRDYRDYFKREGWQLSLLADLDPAPLQLGLEYRDEQHGFVPVGSPWTIRRNDDPWRAQPLVGEGDIQTLAATVRVDTRNDQDRPSHGWFIRGLLLRAVKGGLTVPEVTRLVDDEVEVVPARPLDSRFNIASIDLRRYNRVSPDAEFNIRVLFGGSIDGGSVPPQFQRALGGEGTLPGYSLYSVDCGARSGQAQIERPTFDDDPEDGPQTVYGSFGCDRAALLQLEYRGHLSFNIDLGPDDEDDWGGDWGWYPYIDLDPTWVAFFNLGKGWSRSDSAFDTGSVSDLGLGLFFGDLGFYWAYPLEGDDRGVNFFVRLQARF